MTILVADDNVASREPMREVLQALGPLLGQSDKRM